MSKEVESEIHEDNLCATTSESLTNDETEKKSFASKNEDGPLVNEHVSKRTEKKIMNGMGLLLQQVLNCCHLLLEYFSFDHQANHKF